MKLGDESTRNLVKFLLGSEDGPVARKLTLLTLQDRLNLSRDTETAIKELEQLFPELLL